MGSSLMGFPTALSVCTHHEAHAHVIRPLNAVIPLTILKEAHKQSIHGHLKQDEFVFLVSTTCATSNRKEID